MPMYDAAFAKKRIVNTLREHLIMSACDHGLKKFDMLLGAHDYKSQYAAVKERTENARGAARPAWVRGSRLLPVRGSTR